MSDLKDNQSKRKTRSQNQIDDGALPGNSKKSNTDFVSLEKVKELLKIQEYSLKSMFESSVRSLSKRIDEIVDTVDSIKTSLEYSQKDIKEIKALQEKLDSVNTKINLLENNIKEHDLKVEYLENQSRRSNIRVSGIAESTGETWDQVEMKVKAAIKTKLGMDVDIERAHRVERRKKPSAQAGASASSGPQKHPRTIVCRLRDWKQREAVIRKARKEKPTNLFICEDLAFATLKKREPKIEAMKAAKKAGKVAYFVLDKLIIKDKPTT